AEAWLTHKEQYRWYQVDYQLGVFISRSSIKLLRINYLWIMPILQLANVIILLVEVMHPYLPTIWVMLGIVLFEGLLGGGAYVNTFYKITKEVQPQHREFSMAIASTGDGLGIAIAGFSS